MLAGHSRILHDRMSFNGCSPTLLFGEANHLMRSRQPLTRTMKQLFSVVASQMQTGFRPGMLLAADNKEWYDIRPSFRVAGLSDLVNEAPDTT